MTTLNLSECKSERFLSPLPSETWCKEMCSFLHALFIQRISAPVTRETHVGLFRGPFRYSHTNIISFDANHFHSSSKLHFIREIHPVCDHYALTGKENMTRLNKTYSKMVRMTCVCCNLSFNLQMFGNVPASVVGCYGCCHGRSI